jgi:hypothetical protein
MAQDNQQKIRLGRPMQGRIQRPTISTICNTLLYYVVNIFSHRERDGEFAAL